MGICHVNGVLRRVLFPHGGLSLREGKRRCKTLESDWFFTIYFLFTCPAQWERKENNYRGRMITKKNVFVGAGGRPYKGGKMCIALRKKKGLADKGGVISRTQETCGREGTKRESLTKKKTNVEYRKTAL